MTCSKESCQPCSSGDDEELARLYPLGSVERRVLEYSQSAPGDPLVPPLVMKSLKLVVLIAALLSLLSMIIPG